MAVMITENIIEQINNYVGSDVKAAPFLNKTATGQFVEAGKPGDGKVYYIREYDGDRAMTLESWDNTGNISQAQITLFTDAANLDDVAANWDQGAPIDNARVQSSWTYAINQSPLKMAIVIAALFGEAEANTQFSDQEKAEINSLSERMGLVRIQHHGATGVASTP